MQERTPRRERVGEDELQLLLPGHEGDLAGSPLHGGDQIAWIHLLGRRVGGEKLGNLAPCLVYGHPAGQRVKRSVLGIWQHRLQRFPDLPRWSAAGPPAGSARRRRAGSGRRR